MMLIGPCVSPPNGSNLPSLRATSDGDADCRRAPRKSLSVRAEADSETSERPKLCCFHISISRAAENTRLEPCHLWTSLSLLRDLVKTHTKLSCEKIRHLYNSTPSFSLPAPSWR